MAGPKSNRTEQEWLDLIDRFEGMWAEAQAKLDLHFRGLFEDEDPTLVRCNRCQRVMIPRKLWDRMPKESRPKLFVPFGSSGHCHSCYHVATRKQEIAAARSTPLSEAEVTRLRKQVGLA